MRVLVLVLACRAAPYPMLIETIRETWAVGSEDVIFYYGDADEERLDGADLCLPVPDDLQHVGEKTLAAFEWVLAHREFDVVFRTNCSSYVDLRNLRRFVDAHAGGNGFYAGHLGMHGETCFASGAGYFLSRDLVERAVELHDEWDHAQLDDVALARVLARDGVRPVAAPRRHYESVSEVRDVDVTQFHFRCRTASPRREEDATLIRALHREFERSRRGPAWRRLVARVR
jgi:hypothetical protein